MKALIVILAALFASAASANTLLVATCNSATSSKAHADYVGDCVGDQEEINAAIAALPPTGGSVLLSEGTYDIRRTEGGLGGVLIQRSNVTLEGVGYATRLVLADNQSTNVVRIVGDGLKNIVIENLYIDANGATNYRSDFEACGIRAKSSGAAQLENIVVRDTFIENAARLNAYLIGSNVRIVNNRFGDAGSDVAEIIGGPGLIEGNTVVIASTSGYGLGTDTASGVSITNNIIHVLPSGRLTEAAFRLWGGQYQNIVSNNQVLADGPVKYMLEMRGYFNVASGNVFAARWDQRSRVVVNGGSVLTGNIFENTDIAVLDTSGFGWPVRMTGNFVYYGSVGNTIVRSGDSDYPNATP